MNAERPVTESGDAIYRIPEQNLEGLNSRLVKINRRAARLGMPPIVKTEIGESFSLFAQRDTAFDEIDYGYKIKWEFIPREPAETVQAAQERFTAKRGGHPVFSVRRYVLCTVIGALPRVNGWAMAATIQHEEGGNVLRTVPGFEKNLPVKYRTADTSCEHCQQNRIRKDTYVLEHESGDWKQVGRNCLADFIRSTNAGAWAEAAEMLANLDGEMGGFEDEGDFAGGGSAREFFTADSLLMQVAACIRVDGWCSRGEAKDSYTKRATVDMALNFFDSKFVAKLEPATREAYAVTDADKARAGEAIAWARELPEDVTNDYLWNIRVVSQRELITRREAGLAGSIVSAYARHLEAELKRAYERETQLDEHFGIVGERAQFTLRVTGEHYSQSDYGSLTIYNLLDESGRPAVWFCSGAGELKTGETYTVKATVKKHGERNGRKQTVLNRVVIWDAASELQKKKDRAAVKKLVKARYTCPHPREEQTHTFCVPEFENSDIVLYPWVTCCLECQSAWIARQTAESTGRGPAAMQEDGAACMLSTL
jgi:hypothetical protein